MLKSAINQPQWKSGCCQQRQLLNAPADDVKTYYRLNLSTPVLLQLLIDLEQHFYTEQLLVTNALYLVRTVIKEGSREYVTPNVQAFATQYRYDQPSKHAS